MQLICCILLLGMIVTPSPIISVSKAAQCGEAGMGPGAAAGGQSRGLPRLGQGLCLRKDFLDEGCIPEPELAPFI